MSERVCAKNRTKVQYFFYISKFLAQKNNFSCTFALFFVILHILSKRNIFDADYKHMNNEFLQMEEEVLRMLKTVYDPEIPVNVYDLGLIYKIDLQPLSNSEAIQQPAGGPTAQRSHICLIDMTLTAPNCPAADFLVEDIRQKVLSVQGITDVQVNIVFEPEWTQDMMSDEAKLELGFL